MARLCDLMQTTLKYMHLASGAKEQAMALLDEPAPRRHSADAESGDEESSAI